MSWFVIFLIVFIVFIFAVIFVYNRLVEIRNKYFKDMERMKENLKDRVNILIEIMENTAMYANFDDNDMKALIDFKSQISSANSIEELRNINEAIKKIHYDIWFTLQKAMKKAPEKEWDKLNKLKVRLENLENKFYTLVYDVEKLEHNYKKLFEIPIFSFIKNNNSMFDKELSADRK